MTIQQCDVLILGGGINGVAIARDAAGRGLSVVLCETQDLAAGTSAMSSKLIHGGLRYLEYGDFRLVHESLVERAILLKMAPHIIWPLTFILPWERHLRPRWLIRFGLFLYDHLARRGQLKRSTSLSFSPSSANPLKGTFKHGFRYSDCAVDDARLVILTAISAADLGAKILTHTTCSTLQRHPEYWQASLHNTAQGEFMLHAKMVINATGPWVDQTSEQLIGTQNRHHLQKIKGSHLVVPKFYLGDHAYILQHTDQRIVFVLPFAHGTTLIGTTDIPFDANPLDARLSKEEADYLCTVVNHYFKQQLTPSDALWQFSGVRGLVAQQDKAAPAVSRDYVLEINDQPGAPLLTIFGGKITTHRQLASHALDKIKAFFPHLRASWTATIPLPGGDFQHSSIEAFQKMCQRRYPFLSLVLCQRIVHAYGSRIALILGDATTLDDLGSYFGADLYAAEVDYLMNHEWAISAEDILWRRTKLGLCFSAEQVLALEQYIMSLSL